MDELKIIKLAELRAKMAAIPGKLIVAALLVYGLLCQFKWDVFMENPGANLLFLIIFYGIVSYFWVCVRATGNWIIGIIVGFALFFLWAFGMNKMNGVVQTIIACVICFGGAVMDILHIVRYFIVKKQVFNAQSEYYYSGEAEWEPEEEQDQSYGGQQAQGENARPSQEESSAFFTGCKDLASIKRRYRDLCRVYHPDSGNGSSEVFNKITEEYNRLTAQAEQ